MSNDDKTVKLELLYGHACLNPTTQAVIVWVQPTRWQIIVGLARELWWGVVLPAFLFTLAWTLLTWPFLR